MMWRWLGNAGAVGILLLVAVACGGKIKSSDLEFFDGDPPVVTDEVQRLRDMSALRILQQNPGEEAYVHEYQWQTADSPVTGEWILPLYNYCNKELALATYVLDPDSLVPVTRPYGCKLRPDGTAWEEACEHLECDIALKLCMADLLLGIAEAQAQPLALVDYDDIRYTIGPQSTATMADAAARAARLYDELTGDLGLALSGESGSVIPLAGEAYSYSAQCSEDELAADFLFDEDRTFTEFSTATFPDVYWRGREAFDTGVSYMAAVADAQRGSTPDLDVATARATVGLDLSRAAAAHLLVGGSNGLAGDATNALCSSAHLSPRGQLALGLMRESGLPVGWVMDEGIAISSLLSQVTLRLLARGYYDPQNQGQDVLDAFGLREQDFEEARAYMVDEIEAFDRPRTAHVPMPENDYYAMSVATMAPPTETPPGYWVALARSGSGSWGRPGSSGSYPQLYADGSSLAAFMDRTFTWARYLMETAPSEEVKNAMGAVLQEEGYRGRITQCVDNDPVRFFAEGFSAEDHLYLLRGTDSLRCATTGTLEGASCTADFVAEFVDDRAPLPGFSQRVKAQVEAGTTFVNDDLLYVVQLRPQSEPEPGEDPQLEPGNAELVTAFTYEGLRPDQSYVCHEYPVVPELNARVADLIAPSRESCTESAVSCAGIRLDSRIPLENELSDDSDGVESSWRHYLALADQAAQEADLFGNDYVSASLELDREARDEDLRRRSQEERAIAEMEALQEICGTAISPSALLAELGTAESGEPNLSDVVATDPACSSDDPDCFGSQRLTRLDALVADETGLGSARECLTTLQSGNEPYVHLGNETLCLWSYPPDGEVCGGKNNGGRQCPVVKKDGHCDVPEGTTVVEVPAEDGLAFFDTLEAVSDDPSKSLGDKVRKLRRTPGGGLRDDGFSPPSLGRARDRIDIRLDYGGYVTLLVDGREVGRTGTTANGPELDQWPCGPAGRPLSCDGGAEPDPDTLFCDFRTDCGTPEGRDAANRRLMDAYVAAQVTTWAPGNDAVLLQTPHFLFRDIYPLGRHKATVAAHNGSSSAIEVSQSANDVWRMWEKLPDQAAGDYEQAFMLGGVTWQIERPSSYSDGATDHFAIRAEGGVLCDSGEGAWQGESLGDAGISLRDFYWRGLADASDFSDGGGYYARRLNGQNASAHPWGTSDKEMAFHWAPEEITTDRRAGIRDRLHDRSLDRDVWSRGPIGSSVDYRWGFEKEALLDGLELVAETIDRSDNLQLYCDPENPPELDTMDNLDAMGAYVTCLGRQIEHRAATVVFRNFPRDAIDPLRIGSSTYETQPGTRGQVLSDLRQALIAVKDSGAAIGRTLQSFGHDLEELESTLRLYDIEQEMNDVRFEAEMAANIAHCATGVSEALTANPVAAAGGGLAAPFNCANSVAQVKFARKLRDLQNEATGVQREIAAGDFNRRFDDHVAALETQELALKSALEDVASLLGQLKNQRQEARRLLTRAFWHLSYQGKHQAEINTVLSKRKESARIRYQRARQNAQRMAFLAKRAIEQRLGVALADMHEDLPLVEAPAIWQSSVCTSSGIDYDALSDPDSDSNQNFADSFIGEYVRKLENVVESYRLEHAFHEGTDTAIVSLRDDVHNVRADCEIESRNLLASASRLDLATIAPRSGGWYMDGCVSLPVELPPGEEPNDPPATTPLPNCVSVSPIDLAETSPEDEVPGWRITFGPEDGCALTDSCEVGTSGWTENARIVQTVDLEPGRYLFSWLGWGFGWTVEGAVPEQDEALELAGDVIERMDVRRGITFTVEDTGPVTVGFTTPYLDGEYLSHQTDVGDPMLELLSGSGEGLPPDSIFEDTAEDRTAINRVCEDSDGALFHATAWHPGCMKLCPDGYSRDCREQAETHCYWETTFHVNQRGIESGAMFNQSGFARGNFNYRIESLGLNFVGTGLRTCEDSNLLSTCYGAGYVPYTLIHEGPYFVRNHAGEDYLARLFTGRIEHARGLATERYFSNPIGSADRDLIQDYMRGELQGRPLDGTFTLRVWDEDGFDFDAIEDVQLILKYRYWTRFN